MKSNEREEELLDDSPTDELPVLSELDVVDDFERTSVFVALDDDADTGMHAPLAVPPESRPEAGGAGPGEDSTGRFAGSAPEAGPSVPSDADRVHELEARVAELAAQLADKDAAIASLEERLAATRDAVLRRDETQRQLRAALAEREALSARSEAAAQRREAAAADRETATADREAALAEREARLVERETALEELESEQTDRADALDGRESALDAREASVATREAMLRETVTRELIEISRAREALRQRVEAQIEAYAALGTRLRDRSAELPTAAARDAAATSDAPGAEPTPAETQAVAPAQREIPRGPETSDEGDPRADLIRSREHAAALESYIEGRRAHWREMEARLAEQQARVDELATELEQRAERQQLAQRIAEAESRRVEDLKAEVAALRRLAESRRDAAAPPPAPRPEPATDAKRVAPAEAAAGERGAAWAGRSAGGPEPAAPPHEAPAPGTDLRALTEERDALRQRLEHAQESLRRLERMLVERDRALEASNARLKALHDDGSDHPFDSTWPGDSGSSRLSATGTRNGAAAPTIVCLTGDAPRSYALRRPTVTIGRGGNCDIQIATHFVSREHARLMIRPGRVQIEDLGSKNGVFVNAVRVERETLRHGDLITVGETQFRFVTE